MADEIDKEHLIYFKNLLEGKANISFRAYVAQNEESLRKQISAPRFARLKFKSTDEIEKILNENGIPYTPDRKAIRNEKYLATFHPDALDKNGRLRNDFKEKIFNGLIKSIKNKDKDTVIHFQKYIGYPKKVSSKESVEKLQDIESFAEIEVKFGEEEVGTSLLGLIASIDRQFSEVDDIVLRAKEALANTI